MLTAKACKILEDIFESKATLHENAYKESRSNFSEGLSVAFREAAEDVRANCGPKRRKYNLRIASTSLPGGDVHAAYVVGDRFPVAHTVCGMVEPIGQDDKYDLMPKTESVTCQKCLSSGG